MLVFTGHFAFFGSEELRIHLCWKVSTQQRLHGILLARMFENFMQILFIIVCYNFGIASNIFLSQIEMKIIKWSTCSNFDQLLVNFVNKIAEFLWICKIIWAHGMYSPYCVQSEWFNKQFQFNWWFIRTSHLWRTATAIATSTATIEEERRKVLFYNNQRFGVCVCVMSVLCLWLRTMASSIFRLLAFSFEVIVSAFSFLLENHNEDCRFKELQKE